MPTTITCNDLVSINSDMFVWCLFCSLARGLGINFHYETYEQSIKWFNLFSNHKKPFLDLYDYTVGDWLWQTNKVIFQCYSIIRIVFELKKKWCKLFLFIKKNRPIWFLHVFTTHGKPEKHDEVYSRRSSTTMIMTTNTIVIDSEYVPTFKTIVRVKQIQVPCTFNAKFYYVKSKLILQK